MSLLKPVAAAVIKQQGLVLLARRAVGQKLEGMWEFPGGKLEEGETVEECIVRELFEELGVESVAGEKLTESIYTYPGGSIRLIAVSVSLVSTEFKLSVHDAVEWVVPNDLLSFRLAPADIPIAEKVARAHA